MAERILIVGGTGVFGGRLARLLLADGRGVLVAGRDLAKSESFCAEHGGEPVAFDRDGDLANLMARLSPAVVVDAAGPFQAYGEDPYRVARAALEAGAHYLDLADDPAFAAGIVALDGLARARGLTALSGASTVPAISAAAGDALADGMASIAVIESTVVPGNRAPRGRSLVRAVVGEAGRPLRLWRGGEWVTVPSWSGARRVTIEVPGADVLGPRWTSYVAAPDLALFPARYGARTVLFRAGLELPVLHLGLTFLAWLPRLGLVRSLAPLAEPLRRLARVLEPLGSDRGGMAVAVAGRDRSGRAVRRTWSMIVEAGEGPFVPALPACLLARKALAGSLVPGARPCLGELSIAEIETGLGRLAARTHRSEWDDPPLYERVLGDRYRSLPGPIRALHDVFEVGVFRGEAMIETGRHPLARLCRRLIGMPAAIESIPVEVKLEVAGRGERWTRRFGTRTFRSRLGPAPPGSGAALTERFGPLAFDIALPTDERGLAMPIIAGRLFGLPLPRRLTPISATREQLDDQGRFAFDVDIGLPGIGRVVHYRGWLVPVGAQPSGLSLRVVEAG